MMLGLYTLPQWVLLFFSYGFLGWVWESGYVSVRQRHWVNRGFLHGPVIPIYGFGAVAILALCAPVAGSLPLLFFSGMFWATALEYATGWAMEQMFHVRYWDYTNEKWNLNGYICLMASLCWGLFSVLLLRGIQPPLIIPGDQFPALFLDECGVAGQEQPQPLHRRVGLVAGQGGLHMPVQRRKSPGEQLLLGAEMVIKGPRGNPRLLADVPHRYFVEAVFPGEDHGGLQNSLLSLLGLGPPALVVVHTISPLDMIGSNPL